ncbi:MAG TPA: thioredoxin domain-containing protein [Nocardioides sp.]|nr:thioredoxin domain-containing protein [Nocardioides sp.]
MSSSNKKAADRTAVAAAMRAEQAKREARRRILTIGGVALAMILIVGGAIVFSVVKNNKDNSKIGAAATGTQPGTHSAVLGPDSATHKVIIYEDFLCPFCGELERGSEAQLATLADEGKVQVEYRPFNILGPTNDSYSVRAAGAFSIVLTTSGNAVALKFHNLLYQHQPSEGGPYPSDDDLVQYAVEAGAKESAVKSQIENNAGLSWVQAASKEAFATGLQGTPTIIVDGKAISGTSAEALLAAVS